MNDTWGLEDLVLVLQYNDSPKFVRCWNIHEISTYTVYLLKMIKFEN